MQANEVFTGNARVEVTWNRATPMPELEQKLRALFAEHGLEFIAGGSDLIDYHRTLVFEPIETAVVNYLCPDCQSACLVLWQACPPQEEVKCGECGGQALRS